MKIKRTAAALLAALCTLSAFSCTKRNSGGKSRAEVSSEVQTEENTAEAASEAAPEETSDLNNDLNSYVTVKETAPAMWKGDGIAVEYDISSMMSDFTQIQDFYSKLIYTDGTTVKDHLSEETYEKAKKFMGENMFYNQMMDSYNVGFWEVEIETAAMMKMKNLNEQGVDSVFLSLAQRDGKEIVNVESLDVQTAAMNAPSDELCDFMISQLIDSTEDMASYTESFARQYDLWASGEIDSLDEADVENDIPSDLEDDYADYLEVILYDRNKGMAEKADEFLKEGKNYFFMVGAAHFAGKKGVDDLLEKMGYTVERVA